MSIQITFPDGNRNIVVTFSDIETSVSHINELKLPKHLATMLTITGNVFADQLKAAISWAEQNKKEE